MKTIMYKTLVILLLAGAQTAIANDDMGKEGGKHHRGEKMFGHLDTDSDGVISKAEFIAQAEKRFAKMDSNNDGKLTKEEMKESHAKMKEKFKEMREKRKEKASE